MNIPDSHIMIASSGDVARVCAPLRKYFKINDFNYERIYSDNSKIKLTSRPEWIKYYYQHKFYLLGEYEVPFTEQQTGYKLTLSMRGTEIFSAAREHFNIDYGIVFAEKHNDEYYELFWFGTECGNQSVLNFYLSNIDLLQRFNLYFKEKMTSLITKAEREKIPLLQKVPEGTTRETQSTLHKMRKEFLRAIRIEAYPVENGSIHASLTEREFECAICLLEGRTAKDTGEYLGISSRTVESHLLNIKIKLACETRQDLLEILNRNGFRTYTNKPILFY